MYLKTFFRRFGRAENGNAAMIFALCALPLLVVAGGGLDFHMARSQKQQMQDALDAATLAVGRGSADRDQAVLLAELNRYYVSNGGKGAARFANEGTASDILFATSASYAMPTSMLGIIGIPKMDLNVGAAIGGKPVLEEMTFRLDKVEGWWDKNVSLWGRAVGESDYVELMHIEYRWNGDPSTAGDPSTKGDGLTVVRKLIDGEMVETLREDCPIEGDCVRTVVQGDGTAAVDLIEMDDIYLTMSISAAQPAGANMLKKFRGLPKNLSTQNPQTSDRLFVGGVQQPRGQVIDLTRAVPCQGWSAQAWEDGGTYGEGGPYSGRLPEGEADFRYDVQGRCGVSGRNSGVRLVR